jgi:hypothetical protein
VDAIRGRSADDLIVEECTFESLGGIAVAASHRSEGRGPTIRRNRMVNSGATAIYIGCHDGVRCRLAEVRIEENVIHGVDAPDPQIGYGIQLKLNSWGWIRGNVVVGTKGPGIMVYGATSPDRVTVIERNAVFGSRRSGSIVLGGGPAIVRNNIVAGSAEGGIQLEDYGQRGLLRDIAVVHNTVYGNAGGGITIPNSARVTQVWLVNNAVHAPAGTPGFPAAEGQIVNRGNLVCSVACFRDPSAGDFSPRPDSPLVRGGVMETAEWMPGDDFAGARRSLSPSVGAIERETRPVPLGWVAMPPGVGGSGCRKCR